MQREFAVSTFSDIKIDAQNNAYYIDPQKHLIKWNFKTNAAVIVKTNDAASNLVDYFDISPDGKFAVCQIEQTQNLIDLNKNLPIRTGITSTNGKKSGYPNFYFSENSKTMAEINYDTFGNSPTEIKIFDLGNPTAPEKTFTYQLKYPKIKFDYSGKKMIITSSTALYAYDILKDAAPRLLKTGDYIQGEINPDGKTVTVNSSGSELVDFSTGQIIKN